MIGMNWGVSLFFFGVRFTRMQSKNKGCRKYDYNLNEGKLGETRDSHLLMAGDIIQKTVTVPNKIQKGKGRKRDQAFDLGVSNILQGSKKPEIAGLLKNFHISRFMMFKEKRAGKDVNELV